MSHYTSRSHSVQLPFPFPSAGHRSLVTPLYSEGNRQDESKTILNEVPVLLRNGVISILLYLTVFLFFPDLCEKRAEIQVKDLEALLGRQRKVVVLPF
jgi:hypothetical protein